MLLIEYLNEILKSVGSLIYAGIQIRIISKTIYVAVYFSLFEIQLRFENTDAIDGEVEARIIFIQTIFHFSTISSLNNK